jgi:hypothetical protein
VASAPATTAAGPESGESLPAWADFSFGESDGSSTPPLSAASAGTTEITPDEESDQLWDGPRWRLPALPEIQLPALRLPELPLPQLDWAARLDALPRWSLPAGAAVALGVIALGGWLSLRPRSEPPQRPVASSVQPNRPSPATAPLTTPSQPPQPQPTATLPLTAAEPSEVQLQALLEAWLKAKAAVLAGEQSPLPLNQLARAPQLQVLERQLQANRREGTTEILKATVDSFSIRERTPQRIEAEVSLSYSDQRLGSDGKVLNRTPSTTLNNTYVFGRDGDRWLLVAYQPSR